MEVSSTTSTECLKELSFNKPLTRAELDKKIEDFKQDCAEHETHLRKRCKHRYYRLGLMVRVTLDTTGHEVQRLLKYGARTFFFDTVTTTPPELEQMLKTTRLAIDEFERTVPFINVVAGIALDVLGDNCRIGRMRNGAAVCMCEGEVVTLTIDVGYRYSSFKEIFYVLNLRYYLDTLNLRDVIKIGPYVKGRVIKRLRTNVAVMVLESGAVQSYDFIELPDHCYVLKKDKLPSMYKSDLELLKNLGADYIVLQKTRSKPFLDSVREAIRRDYSHFKTIGELDLEFIRKKMLDLMGLIKLLDYVWVTNAFKASDEIQQYINDDVLPLSRCLKRPVVATVPIERCSDFKWYQNHDLLWKIDAMFIEKSTWCNRYPLIVTKLLRVRDISAGFAKEHLDSKKNIGGYKSVVTFIMRTCSTIETQAIILHTECQKAATALALPEIYCPVYVVLPLDDPRKARAKVELARSLNLRRNVRGIVYSPEVNQCNMTPIDFGIDYLKRIGMLETGDFIITVVIGKEDGDSVEFGVGEDVVVMRAFYLPPMKTCEIFKYGCGQPNPQGRPPLPCKI